LSDRRTLIGRIFAGAVWTRIVHIRRPAD